MLASGLFFFGPLREEQLGGPGQWRRSANSILLGQYGSASDRPPRSVFLDLHLNSSMPSSQAKFECCRRNAFGRSRIEHEQSADPRTFRGRLNTAQAARGEEALKAARRNHAEGARFQDLFEGVDRPLFRFADYQEALQVEPLQRQGRGVKRTLTIDPRHRSTSLGFLAQCLCGEGHSTHAHFARDHRQ